MELFDSHCHLQLEQFDDDREEVHARAQDGDVTRMTVIGIDARSSRDAIEFCQEHDRCYPTAGLHPHEADLIYEQSEALQDLASEPDVVAIGETGLDYYKELSPKTQQEESLVTQIGWAIEMEKPLIFHCRDADDDLIEILAQNKEELDEAFPEGGAGVVHCFSGTPDHLRKFQEMGFYTSFSGILTYPNAGDLREAAAVADPDMVLIETDSPFLAPQQHRGKRNEPAYVKETAETLGDLLDLTLEEVAEVTTRNAKQLFGVE